MAEQMTKAYRANLERLARKRAKVAESMIGERVKVLRADIEDRLSAEHKIDDELWADVNREAKAAIPSAAHWRAQTYAEPSQASRALLRRAKRSPDAALRLEKAWILRRLSPETRKIELDEVIAHGRAARLVRAMGIELANLHLGTAFNPHALRRYLRVMPKDWLAVAAERMAYAIARDRAVFVAGR